MGMPLVWILPEIGRFLGAHWLAFSLAAAAVAVCAGLEFWWVRSHYPADTNGNGITIGRAKAFDNRSLALRVERLSAGLETLKVVNQSVAEGLTAFQEQTSSETTQSLSVGVKDGGAKNENETDAKKRGDKEEKTDSSGAGDTTKADSKPKIGLAASDLLSDQLNLASQIFNLQLLYERSLSDRMIGEESRLQTVLGFQVSITPPSGYEDCVAVAEVEVRMKPAGAGAAGAASPPAPVSLVALMPQEKTYNAESISSSERSIGGSAVARVVTLGYRGKKGTRQLFVHRDSDTVAFEHQPKPETGATVFGWEFRPVLGRRTVSAGTRQMMAVIAIPATDDGAATDSILEVKTRSYWRRYNRKRQTSSPNWGWVPWKVDRSATLESATQELNVPNTAKIQLALAPKVSRIAWVNSGQGKATVIVRGSNFFSGTKIVIGGEVHREETGTLTLKSDQALEFETTIDSLTTGDGVLSGRFGPALQLNVPESKLPVASLNILGATIRPLRKSKAFRISIDICGYDEAGNARSLTVEDMQKLPDAILFVGNEPVAMPYDYQNRIFDAAIMPVPPNQPSPVSPREGSAPAPAIYYVRVEAWIPSQTLSKSSSVSFRVPFCGFDYQTSQPLSFSDPTVVRMGQDPMNTVFRIFYPQGFGSASTQTAPLSIDLDQTYMEGPVAPAPLVRTSDTEYRFTVPTVVLSQYQNMVVRIGKAEPYLVPIPPVEKTPLKATIDPAAKPPQVAKTTRGPVEWSGWALDAITDVNLIQPSTPGANVTVPQQFSTYGDGTRLLVYLSAGATDTEGKVTLECATASGDKLSLPLFVTRA
jgi:hypothetical protein